MMTAPVSRPQEFRYEWNRAEFTRGARALQKHARRSPWNRTIWLIAVPAILWMNVDAATKRSENVATALLSVGAVFLAILALGWLLSRIAIVLLGRYWERQLGGNGTTMTARLTDEGYTAATAAGEVSLLWSAIPRAVETPEFLLLYADRGFDRHLPLRAIPEDQLAAVRSLLRDRLGSRATLRDQA